MLGYRRGGALKKPVLHASTTHGEGEAGIHEVEQLSSSFPRVPSPAPLIQSPHFHGICISKLQFSFFSGVASENLQGVPVT